MRVLMFSLDRKILERDSAVQRRLIALAEKAGELTVFVPAKKDERQQVSLHLTVRSAGGAKFFQFPKLWGVATRELQREQYDFITVQDIYFFGFLAVKLAEKFSLPMEVQVHGFEKMRWVRGLVARHVLGRAAKIRVVSERLKKLLTTYYLLPSTKIYVLPVYTQMGETGEMGERERKPKGVPYPFTFLTVGRLVSVKNIALQILAFARLAKEYPQIRLRIVGDGPERNNLQLITNKLQLGDKVVFEGEQKDVGRFYKTADAFLLTSDYEGWGRVALEAAAYRLPIVMTNAGLANEVLHHDKECIVIPVGDEEQLYGAMKEVLEHPELRSRLGAAAYRVVKTLPSAEEQIQKQVEEWHGLQ